MVSIDEGLGLLGEVKSHHRVSASSSSPAHAHALSIHIGAVSAIAVALPGVRLRRRGRCRLIGEVGHAVVASLATSM